MTLLSNTLYDVAIIGAGIAGTYCANTLQQAGYQVCLLEKGRGTGGRASSRRLAIQQGEAQQSCDLGAPFFNVEGEQLTNDIQQWLADGVIAPWPAANKANSLAYTGVPSMSALTRYLAQHVDTYAQQRVSHIDRTEHIWSLRNDTYKTLIKAKRVIITAPAAQSAQLLTSLDAPSSFLQQAHLASHQCRAQWAVVVSNNNPSSDCLLKNLPDMLEQEHPLLAKIICDSAKPAREASVTRWVLQANIEWSEAHKDDDAESVGQAMLAAFKSILLERTGVSSELEPELKPEFEIATPHLWRLGRHESTCNALGKVQQQQAAAMLWHKENGLAVAADWLGAGTVVSAILSAQQLCQAMIIDDGGSA